MPDWNTEKGIAITDATPTGDAGVKLNDNFERLRDETPFNTASDPTVNDDSGDGFFAGSQWFNTSTQVMWICTDATATVAVWRSLYKRQAGALILCPSDGSDQRAIQLDLAGNTRGDNAVDFQTSRNSDSQVASGVGAFIAAGAENIASGNQSHAEGSKTTASGNRSHAEGNQTTASAAESHAEGLTTQATNSQAHAEGRDTLASGLRSHAEGMGTTASGVNSHAEGNQTTAYGADSHAEGFSSQANGSQSHAEGRNTTAEGNFSHAEGWYTTASGVRSHAEGSSTTATGVGAHAEGSECLASGNYSHAQGKDTTASGNRSHAEGTETLASGSNSHAQGSNSTASGGYSHSQGRFVTAGTSVDTHVLGKGQDDSNRLVNNTSGSFLVGFGGTVGALHVIGGGSDGRVVQSAIDGVPVSGDLWNESAVFYLDETADQLKVKVKFGDGTVKTAVVADFSP